MVIENELELEQREQTLKQALEEKAVRDGVQREQSLIFCGPRYWDSW